MLLQCRLLVLIDASASHNEVHAFRSEPCRLFQLALHAVFYSVFLNCFQFPVTLMRAGPSYMGMSAHAHSAVPAPSCALLRHRCVLLSAGFCCQDLV